MQAADAAFEPCPCRLPPVGGGAATRSITQAADAKSGCDTFLEQCRKGARADERKEPLLPFNFKETKGRLAFQTACWLDAALTPCVLERVFRTSSEILLAGCTAMRQGKRDGPEIETLVRATDRTISVSNRLP